MLLDLFRFLAFTLRPATRSPAVFGWIDVLRAFGAVGGVSGLGVLGRWLDRSIETAEAGPMTPDWLFTVVLPLVGFACLTVFAGTRFPVNPDPILTNAPQPNSPRFLFAYANDQPLMFAHPPPSSLKVLLSITVKADNTPPVYAVCLFDPVPETHLEYGPPDDKGGRRVSGSVDPFLKVLKVSIAKPSLASFQNPNPDIPNAESAITPE